MVFSDLFFLFVFLPSCAILYLLAGLIDRKSLQPNGRPVNTLKNAVLVLFSLIFYAWGEPVYVFLMLGCVLWNYPRRCRQLSHPRHIQIRRSYCRHFDQFRHPRGEPSHRFAHWREFLHVSIYVLSHRCLSP